MNRIKVLLVDDHDIVIDGIAALLDEAPDLKVVGKASSVAQAQTLIQQLDPDLVLTDISLGDISGLELTRWIAQQFSGTRVMVLTMYDDVPHITAMLEAGALGYLLKNVRQEEMLLAIKQVMSGRQYMQQSIAGRYARSLRQQQEAILQSPLTPREIEIIRLIAKEFTTAQISQELFLSEHTVDTHRKNIIRKTGVKSSIGLVNYAREQGLLL